jgi:hypothetical protein
MLYGLYHISSNRLGERAIMKDHWPYAARYRQAPSNYGEACTNNEIHLPAIENG